VPAKVKKLTNPKAIDMECLMSTKDSAVSRDPGMIEMLADYFHTMGLRIKTEEEQAQDWREAGVQVVIMSQAHKNLGFTEWSQVVERHNYIGQLKKDYPDVVLGFWVGISIADFSLWKPSRKSRDVSKTWAASASSSLECTGYQPTIRCGGPSTICARMPAYQSRFQLAQQQAVPDRAEEWA
jgi:hypothetical protein